MNKDWNVLCHLTTLSKLPVPVSPCVSCFSLAVIIHHDKGNLSDNFLLAYGSREISPLQCQVVTEADRRCPKIKKLKVHIFNNKYTMRPQGIGHQKALWLGVKCS